MFKYSLCQLLENQQLERGKQRIAVFVNAGHRLGRPLPHQPANRTWAHPVALLTKLYSLFRGKPMRYCQQFLADIPHHRVDDPRVTQLTRIAPCAFDLHVLGTPLAFILSQDQTRHFVHGSQSIFLTKDVLSVRAIPTILLAGYA
jgi:hypothetical protein